MSSNHAVRESVLSEPQSPAVRSVTPVGVDVGFRTLVAAAPRDGRVEDVFTIDGDHVERTLDALAVVDTALDGAAFTDTATRTAVAAAVWTHRLKGQVYGAAHRTVEFARSHPGAVLVVEDLPAGDVPLARWWRHDAFEAQTWAVNALSRALVEVAVEAGLPVVRVDPAGTSTECHRCGETGRRERSVFECTANPCTVDVVDADVNAALTVASRV